MRAQRLTSWFVLGLGVALAYAARRRRGALARRAAPEGAGDISGFARVDADAVAAAAAIDAAARGAPAGASAGITPDQVDPTVIGRADESADMFVEAIAAWDLEPTPDLDVEVADPADEPRASAPAGSRVEPHPYADADLDDPALLGDAARADVYGDRAALGGGELYGVHVTAAADRELPDDDLAQDEGENWLERLETSATESGPEPEHMIDINEDTDPRAGHHRTATSDTPVADLGSGGPRGL